MDHKLGYHLWATDKLLDHLDSLEDSVFHAEIQSVFPSIERTLYHQYEVDALWFSRLRKQERPLEVDRFSTASECKKYFQKLHREIAEWEYEGGDILYQTSDGEAFENATEEILYHIVNHGTYHRGNISAMLWQLGEKGVSTDYIYYVREKEERENES
ncbi:DinB family protein [Bacillus sp. KH172YL63]|uniref:DinB family protein n=1 Tax=Bacillus sp. KH172YL63 TaxID=2709784 RepID=UPI0013E4FC9D|nr:DinB family protein [Bacillus sp. KH172YL63]BCB06022.1 hypothetical protein KH172YL63_41550 [Bacillus sp. KH172YL63]